MKLLSNPVLASAFCQRKGRGLDIMHIGMTEWDMM